MSERPKRIRGTGPDFESWSDLARAIRETGTAIVEQMRESFGPLHEVRETLVADPGRALKDTLDAIRPIVVEATPEEATDPLTVKAKLHHALKVRVRDDLLTLCGFEDGAETTAYGSADNDLAHERADAIMTFLALAQRHSLPAKLLPRGDRTGDWLPPGTPVVVHGAFPGVVAPEKDTVLVQVSSPGWPRPVEFPRGAVAKEGEPWMPQTHTES